MNSITNVYKLRWKLANGEIIYFLNNKFAGSGTDGFNHILQMIKNSKIKTLVIEYKLLSADTGKSVKNSFPFKENYHLLQELSRIQGFSITLEDY